MPMYKLVWEIEINAETPLEAARKALEYQRDPDGKATVFDIIAEDGEVTQVDLLSEKMAIVCEKEKTTSADTISTVV